MSRVKILVILLVVAILPAYYVFAAQRVREIIVESVEGEDMSYQLRQAIDEASKYDEVKIILTGGVYNISNEFTQQLYLPITNHGNRLKSIAFPFSGHKSVEIEGRGSKLLFQGQMLPFLFEDCAEVKVSGVTIDWETPYTFLAEVVAIDPDGEWREVKPRREEDGFSWVLKSGKINFPNIDGFNYSYLGSTLAFDAKTKRPVVGALDLHSDPARVEELPNGNLKIYERLRQMPPVGSLLSSKGDRKQDRYAPAFNIKESSNITIENVTIHHALGMGFLFERSEDITIRNSNIMLEDGSLRVISTTADATHFANCRGEILIEGCRFENMLDDGTNVHGTYVVVSDVLDDNTIIAELQHFEQMGFKFAASGDELWLIHAPSPKRGDVAVVKSFKQINEKIMEIKFDKSVGKSLKEGDLLENKSWNPRFTMRGCTIQNHRARSVVLKSPLKT
ncbi:MAG: right-handed parallel beta-helix repeat-containing protein, partial [Rikenellaceae bacterium]